jgi:hypothetical protein
MTDTKKTDTKEKPSAGKEIAKDKISSQEMPEQETIGTPQATAEIEKEKRFLGEVAEDIGEGAKMVGGKASELTDIVVDKLKKGLSQAYAAGAKAVDELFQTAQEYAEKYRSGHCHWQKKRCRKSCQKVCGKLKSLPTLLFQWMGGLARIFYGSVAAGILNRVDRPLFIVRSRWAG